MFKCCCTSVEVRGQFMGVNFLHPVPGWNSGHETWWQVPLPRAILMALCLLFK